MKFIKLLLMSVILISANSFADCAYYLVTNLQSFKPFACLDEDNDTRRIVEIGFTFGFMDSARNPVCNGGDIPNDQDLVNQMAHCLNQLNPNDPYDPNSALLATIDLEYCPQTQCFMLYPPQDNCPLTFNYDQSDIDGDNIGDACDSDIDGDATMQEAVDYLTAHGYSAHGIVVEGSPAVAIPDQAAEFSADMIVMGAVGRSGIMKMLIGDTAGALLASSETPLYLRY